MVEISSELGQIDMWGRMRERLPLYWRKLERIHYWNEEYCIGETKTILYDC